jgi:hypothetical protein
MTQLFSLLNQVFAHHSNSRDLEQYINAHSPNNAKDVEELTRGYLYQSNGPEEV